MGDTLLVANSGATDISYVNLNGAGSGREVFRYAAAGLGNKEVAGRLAISEATVKVHLTHIFQKLGVRGRAELAAAFHGVISPAQ